MGSLSIQKGKRAERAVAILLRAIIETVCTRLGCAVVELRRNLKQSQIGGFDLDGIDWIAIEIKHHATLQLNSWWDQTLRQAVPFIPSPGAATQYKREPVLIYKLHGGKWRVRMFGRLEIEPGRRLRVPVDIAWDDFAAWFERRLETELKKSAS